MEFEDAKKWRITVGVTIAHAIFFLTHIVNSVALR